MYINRLSEGSYNPLTNRIKVGGFGDESKKSTALHEIQHAIQTKEGHGMGGSPTSSNQLSKDQRFESARQAYNNSEGLNGILVVSKLEIDSDNLDVTCLPLLPS